MTKPIHINNQVLSQLAVQAAKRSITFHIADQNAPLVFTISGIAELLTAHLYDYIRVLKTLEVTEERMIEIVGADNWERLRPNQRETFKAKFLKEIKSTIHQTMSIKNLMEDWFDKTMDIPERNRKILDAVGDAVAEALEKLEEEKEVRP